LFWGLDIPQVIDLAILVIFLSWLIIKLRQFKKQSLATAPASEALPGQNQED